MNYPLIENSVQDRVIVVELDFVGTRRICVAARTEAEAWTKAVHGLGIVISEIHEDHSQHSIETISERGGN